MEGEGEHIGENPWSEMNVYVKTLVTVRSCMLTVVRGTFKHICSHPFELHLYALSVAFCGVLLDASNIK